MSNDHVEWYIYVRFQCRSVKRKFALIGHKRIFAREQGRRTNDVVQQEKKERNAWDTGFNLKHDRSRRESVKSEIERVVFPVQGYA
jgi:hypothetical protein